MKKLVIISVLFALLTGAAFAEVTLSGSVETGIQLQFDNTDWHGEDFAIRNFDAFGARVNLTGVATTSAGTAGLNFRLRGQTAGDVFSVPYAWVWYQPMDMLRIMVGKLDGDGFGTGSRIDASNDVGGSTGLHFRLTPMDGLRVGLTLTNTSFKGGSGGFGGHSSGNINDTSLRIGVVYTMADTFRAAINAAIPFNGISMTDDKAENIATGINMAFGVQILALKDLGFSVISVDALLENLGDDRFVTGTKDKRDASVAIGQRLTFATGDLTVTEELRVDIGGKQTANGIPKDKMAMRVNLTGAYKIDTLTANLGIGLGVNRAGGNAGADPRSWNGTGQAFSEDGICFVINPSVTFPLAGSNVTIGYGMNAYTIKDKDPKIGNAIYANFSISF